MRHAILTTPMAVRYEKLLLQQRASVQGKLHAVEYRIKQLDGRAKEIRMIMGANTSGSRTVLQYELQTIRNKRLFCDSKVIGLNDIIHLLDQQIKDNSRYMCYMKLLCGGLIWKVTWETIQGQKVMIWELFDSYEEEEKQTAQNDAMNVDQHQE